MTTYGNSKSAVNEKVGEIGQELGYSNSIPGLIKRLDGIKERIASDELDIENLQDNVGEITENVTNITQVIQNVGTDLGDVEDLVTQAKEAVGAINEIVGSLGMQWIKLWENPNPNKPFIAQTVSIPNVRNKTLAIVWNGNADENYTNISYVWPGYSGLNETFFTSITERNVMCDTRAFQINQSGVSFDVAYNLSFTVNTNGTVAVNTPASYNNLVIPVAIYELKEVN